MYRKLPVQLLLPFCYLAELKLFTRSGSGRNAGTLHTSRRTERALLTRLSQFDKDLAKIQLQNRHNPFKSDCRIA
jgi:hypothetical protein